MISTIRYRFEKSVKGSHQAFGDFSLGKDSRSPKEIIHHMNDVIYSTRFFIEQESMPKEVIKKLNFENEIERFKAELSKVDQLLDFKSLDITQKDLSRGRFQMF